MNSCMGGWCTRRDHCANYHAASAQEIPAERLCPPGRDGADMERHHEQAVQFGGFTFNLVRVKEVA